VFLILLLLLFAAPYVKPRRTAISTLFKFIKLRIMNLMSLVVILGNSSLSEWIALGKQLLNVFVREMMSLLDS
jgi:hypothetical protein